MKNLYVADLKPGISVFGEVFVVKSQQMGSTKQNQPYIDLELSDKTGTIKAKIWSDAIESCDKTKPGDAVILDGMVEEYRSKPQLKISKMTISENYDPLDFQTSSEYSPKEMEKKITDTISDIRNPYLKSLLKNVFNEEILPQFLDASAARTIHHAYRGGLAEHTVEMLYFGETVLDRYPKMSRDLLFTGILLHDIGKLWEYENVLVTTVTTQGKLVGHITIGVNFVRDKALKEMPSNLLDEVTHLILSHHGSLEFGSPVLPKTAEAIALSYLDRVSAFINASYHAIHNLPATDEFTDYQKHFGSEFYKSPYLDELKNGDIPF